MDLDEQHAVRIVAKLTAAAMVSPRRLDDPIEHLAWVESGSPFEQAGIQGFLDGVPPDAAHATGEQVAAALRAVEASAWSAAGLGALHAKAVARAKRHALGAYYTPAWLVRHVLDRAGFDGRGDDRLLDPMCGAGAFLTEAIARLRAARPDLPASELLRRAQGMDVDPLAVLMARAAYLEALAPALAERREGPLTMPVLLADAILAPPRDTFDVIAGNPPWIGWESLAPGYREATRPLWKHHGLFPDGGGAGMQALLGRGRKDLSMLATYAVAETMLRPGGRLAFVITQAVFKSVGSGAGFRRFVLGDGTPLRVLSVDDLGELRVFPGAGAPAAVMALVKGEPTRYPVPYAIHRRRGGRIEEALAEPVDPADAASAWITGGRDEIETLRRVMGPSSYRARAGAYTGGANGVYWVEVREGGGAAASLVSNLAGSGKRSVPTVSALVEEDLLYPLLRARDVKRFAAEPAAWILMPQDPDGRRGIDESRMRSRYPLCLAYLERFRDALARRRDRGTRALIDHGAPFYSIFSVSRETLADWKVVWPRIASRVTAAAVGPCEGKPVIPQETCTFIACRDRDEACYLAGMLNSALFDRAAVAFAQKGGKSFGAPHLLRHIAVPRYDAAIAAHRELAALVRGGPAPPPASDLEGAAAAVWDARRTLDASRLPDPDRAVAGPQPQRAAAPADRALEPLGGSGAAG